MAETKTKAKTSRRSTALPKITDAMAERIHSRLLLTGGTMLREMGADLAERFGLMKQLREQRSKFNREVLTVAQQKKADQLQAQERDPSIRSKEITRWTEAVLRYVVEFYGPEVKDGLGYTVGYGDRVEFNKATGHLKLKW